ncbi:MAG: hypothetical protein NC489_26360, partial [Ruminococcus flavefaciens]|nr:hypothetical protein [Ruminococcus flavefaciens]
NGDTGNAELHSNNAEDEAQEDEMFTEWGKQSGESAVPERKQRTDRNDRQVHGRTDIYNTDAEDRGDIKCSKNA